MAVGGVAEEEGRILLVEDDEAHAELIRRAFVRAGEPAPHHVTLLSDARAALSEGSFGLLLVDMRLPDGDGAELLPGEATSDATPVVLMTSHGDEQIAVDAMRRGAGDYVVKSDESFREMPRVVERVRREWALVREREHAEQRLRSTLISAAREWRETFDGLSVGILVVDEAGRVRRANTFAVRQAGHADPSALIDREVSQLGPGQPWSALAELASAALRGESVSSREIDDASTGATFYAAASLLPATEEAPLRVILNFQDVSETARLKERLRQSETMAEIGSLVAGVAHEVRNPLFSISATLDAFESRHGRQPSFEPYLGVLRDEIGRLTDVMRDLLEFGRGAELELEEVTLAEVVELAVSSCRTLARSRGVEVAVSGAGAEPLLKLDRQKVAQVIENLISNAIHFSEEGGTVSVELLGRGSEDGSPAAAWCHVRDRGPGIAEGDLPRLFEPFFTRRSGGTGLGLSIVRRIVQEHGGEVTAENHPEGGALLTVRLPAGDGRQLGS